MSEVYRDKKGDMAQDDGNQNFDTKYTKIYVGGLPWRTRTDGLRTYFRQFGEIIHANVVCNRYTGRSEGYGFVTFRHAESATRACQNPNPIVEGREAKCQLAYFGARVYNNQNVDQQLQVLPMYPTGTSLHRDIILMATCLMVVGHTITLTTGTGTGTNLTFDFDLCELSLSLLSQTLLSLTIVDQTLIEY
ncbi:LOW QUALITY PROTEIN: 31 kDa ribonucleoprotein, chloroplastic [Capsella rubella]|uniref:LOW QUALITY PROTEIN: 31 kDa ribonucleoprotein, chloroplastic n=1 Tax=Capsella rubella TaxID=81985 RepID=UPI000CD55E43|nr:LOW QUALITY PROTEIN: 31 kDa ribonucleoprotein, chloroplastic [Capsella rubella]